MSFHDFQAHSMYGHCEISKSGTGVYGLVFDKNIFDSLSAWMLYPGGIVHRHTHKVYGDTSNNQAQLTGTGNNQHFDVRQLFTVVQYIIYIQN
jgi:hypothetical protein